MNKLSDIAFKNTISNLILQLIVIVSGFIVPKLLISHFGSDTYGLVSSITQFLGFISLLEVGVGPVIKSILYKYTAKKDKINIQLVLKAADKFFRKIGYIFIGYVIVLCFLFPIMNDEFDGSLTVALIIVMAISTFFEYFYGIVYNIYLQADKKYYVTSLVQSVCYILNIIFVVGLVYLDSSIVVVKLASTLTFLIRPIFQSYYVRKKMNINFKNIKGDYKITNKFDGLSQHIAFVIYSNTDVAVLTIFANFSTVAIYSVYNIVITAIKNVVSAFVNGIDSIFGDLFANGETKKLKYTFEMYEYVFYTVAMTLFLTTLVLIVPFVRIYTAGINDADYIQPLFALFMVLASITTSSRTIYSSLVYSIGHFKQTNFISWIEAIVNIVVSLLLVIKFGLVGVAIGTFIASLIRLIYFMYYSSSQILKRSNLVPIKWLFVIILEVVICLMLMNFNIFSYAPTNYLNWFLYAIVVFVVIVVIVVVINLIFNFRQWKMVLKYLKGKKLFKR